MTWASYGLTKFESIFDAAVESVFQRANAAESRDSASYRASLQKREAARQAIDSTLRLRGLTVLAYPSLRRKAALIGQPQAGSNCQLSATTGLPAIAVPAGFTVDGLPIGFELLGAAFSEPTLLRVAYAYERLVSPRRRPKATP